jgi:hypothetical protein
VPIAPAAPVITTRSRAGSTGAANWDVTFADMLDHLGNEIVESARKAGAQP